MSSPTVPSSDTLSIAEMVRVLDVASEVRRKQLVLERQWNADAAREELREKLLATQATTGEELTPEQVDAAIDWYYDRLHRFKQPKKSLGYGLAHLYVRRAVIFRWLVVVAVVVGGFLMVRRLWSGERSKPLSVETKVAEIRDLLKAPDPRIPIDRWQTAIKTGAITPQLRDEISEYHGVLSDQYAVVVADWSPEERGVPSQWSPYPDTPGMPNGEYVYMTVDGDEDNLVGVTDWRTGERRKVRRWFQAVPAGVRERHAVHDSRYYAYKWPGQLDWEILLEDPRGELVGMGPQMFVDGYSDGNG